MVFRSPEAEEHPAARILCKRLLSFSFALARARIEAAAFANALPETLSLLGSHMVPAVGETIYHSIDHTVCHAKAVTRIPRPVHSESSEQDPAEGQQSEGLPEAEQRQSEERRRQPVPQQLHDFAADEDE